MNHLLIFLLMCLAALSGSQLYAQVFSFSHYDQDEGLPQSTVYHIMQDSKGYMWFATAGGASRFDGTRFFNFTTKEGLINNRVNDILEDQFGNIWFATIGGITIYTDSELSPRFIRINQNSGLSNNRVNDLEINRQGDVLLSTSTGIDVIKKEAIRSAMVQNQPKFTFISLAIDSLQSTLNETYIDSRNTLWLATQSGLIMYDTIRGVNQTIHQVDGLPSEKVNTIEEDAEGNIWCGTETGFAKLVISKNHAIDSIISITHCLNHKIGSVYDIHINRDGTIMITTPYTTFFTPSDTASLGYIPTEVLTSLKGLNSNSLRSLYEDREGHYWFGSSSKGVCKLNGKRFELFNSNFGMRTNSVRALVEDQLGNMWFGTSSSSAKMPMNYSKTDASGLYQFIESNVEAQDNIQSNSIWSMIQDSKGIIWIGSVHGGVIKYDGTRFSRFSNRNDFLGKVAMFIYEDNQGQIWFLTFKGTNVYNSDLDKIMQPFPEDSRLYHKRLTAMLQEKDGTYWFTSANGLTRWKDHEFKYYQEEDGLPNNYVLSIIPDKKSNLWMATGNGIVMYNKEDFFHYTTQNGLNSDTPYLLVFDDQEKLWVGTNQGLDRITFNTTYDIESINHFGKTEGYLGGECNARAAIKDSKGDLWFGTMNGAVRYTGNDDTTNSIEPLTYITNISINYRDTLLLEELSLNHDQNRIGFKFIGVTMASPEKVKYKFILEGFDKKWSPNQKETSTTFSNLPYGKYTFKVLSCNSSGIWNSSPTSYTFKINPPFWKTIWFTLVVGIVIILLIGLYVRLKTKSLEISKQELEERVQERTRALQYAYEEISTQKEEIELNRDQLEAKNRNITDSIEYAQIIQNSMLADKRFLNKTFADSFILYQPRDIVSGDFFWFEEKDNRVYFAAADCTGHGVPGAFVSIIGYNCLARALNEFKLTSTNDILDKLRELMKEYFSRGKDTVNDGMDICLCAFDKNSKKVEFSGAYNPLFVISNNQLTELKGDKQPIGPHRNQKPFTKKELQLKTGDQLYLFSDGYTDQFGGPNYKKLKLKTFKTLLLNCHNKKLSEQKYFLLTEFNKWKGENPQIDDVCIIGIRV